jgi:hypothetical protein
MSHEGYAPPVPQRILPDPRYLVMPQLGAEHAQPRIRAEMCDGALRPPDAAEASRIEALHALIVPFWRVEIARPDHVMRAADERRGYLGVPVSHDSPSDGRAAWMVCARFRFPYEMKHPTLPIPGDARPLVLPLRVLQQGDPDPSWGWEEVQADIDHAAAVELAMTSYRKFAVEPDALWSGVEPAIQAVHFVRYPVWLARYRYRNERAPSADGMFHVGVSALDGAAIMALHPSKLAAGAAKLKKMFGL